MSSALQGLQATKQIRTALEKASAEAKALPKQIADAETKLASAKGALGGVRAHAVIWVMSDCRAAKSKPWGVFWVALSIDSWDSAAYASSCN